MLESLEITNEEEPAEPPRTESKANSRNSLMKRFNMCFNELEQSEIITIITTQSMA